MKSQGKEAVMFVVFLTLMFLIAIGIVSGVSLFFSKKVDVRYVESQILFSAVSSCLERHNFFSPSFNLTSDCGILYQSSERLILVRDSSNQEFSSGVYDFETQCFLIGLKDREDSPQCIFQNVSVGEQKYSVLIASATQSRRGE